MKVDLQQLKTQIETELQELERRKSVLKEQLTHIESVEQMASGTFKAGEVGHQPAGSKESDSGDSTQTGEGKSWFRR